jgi:hypothetical protein
MQERKEQEKCCDVEIDPDKIRILLRFVDPEQPRNDHQQRKKDEIFLFLRSLSRTGGFHKHERPFRI